MRYKKFTPFGSILLIALFIFGFKNYEQLKNRAPGVTSTVHENPAPETLRDDDQPTDSRKDPKQNIPPTETRKDPQQFVEFAKTLIGTPYVYGSENPAVGFDCSGFVNYVSNHFGIEVPRSSVQFTDFGKEIEQNNAMPGDLILFTGSNPSERVIGHIGIVTENPGGKLSFIHSSSGKSKGVTISEMSDHYKTRFVKIIRILPSSENNPLS